MEYIMGGLVVWWFSGFLISSRYDVSLIGFMVGLFMGPFTAIVALNYYRDAIAKERYLNDLLKRNSK
jgi:hypothetical protein